MPRYRYACKICNSEQIKSHLYDEAVDLYCEKCDSTDTLQKILGNPYYKIKEDHSKENSVGQLTKEYIEENRIILEKEKKRVKEETYEPS
jgi:hypothetical protein